MDITSAHYQFKLNKDRIDTLATQDFNRAEIDWLLNEAQLVFVKQRLTGSNNKLTGFENTQKRIDDLATIVIKFPLQPSLSPINHGGVYEVPLDNLSYKYLYYIAGYVDAVDDEGCAHSNVRLRFTQHDDYREALKDPFNGPSKDSLPFNFGRATSSTSPAIYIYPGNFVIDKVYLDYIKYPSQVNIGNYTYIDGNIYPPTTFELPDHTHPEIIDIACQIAALNIENPEYIQLKSQKVFIHE